MPGPFVADRVRETSTTTGTGTLNLLGAVSNFITFVSGIATTNTAYYAIVHQSLAEWEVGIGTVTSGAPDTLSRTTVLASSNANALVSFSAGTKDVFSTIPGSGAALAKCSHSRTLSVQRSATDTLDAAVIGTTETNFATNFSMRENSLIVGKQYRLTIAWQNTTSASPPTTQIRVKLGTVVLFSSIANAQTANLTNVGITNSWIFQAVTTGVTGTIEASAAIGSVQGAGLLRNSTAQPVTVDTTIASTLQFSLQYGSGTAGNTQTLRQFLLEEVN